MGEGCATFVWICDRCSDRFFGNEGEGYLMVTWADVQAVRTATEEWQERHAGAVLLSADDLVSLPRPAHWRVVHARCADTEPEIGYQIDLIRITCPAEALAWSAHLLGKDWLELTDWAEVIRALGHEDGRPHHDRRVPVLRTPDSLRELADQIGPES